MPSRTSFAIGGVLMTAPLKRQLLYMQDVAQLTGKHPITLRRWWNQGKFPKPTKHSVLVWRAEIIFQWITENIQGNE